MKAGGLIITPTLIGMFESSPVFCADGSVRALERIGMIPQAERVYAICIIAIEAVVEQSAGIDQLLLSFLKAGAVHFGFFGPSAEMLHDRCDEP